MSEASDMTEQQASILLETSAKLAPRIQELCENKIAENLRLVNEQTAKKFENMLTYIKDSTATFSETLLADHEKLLKRIVEMQDIIETLKRAQDESAKRRNDFLQVKVNFFMFYSSMFNITQPEMIKYKLRAFYFTGVRRVVEALQTFQCRGGKQLFDNQ